MTGTSSPRFSWERLDLEAAVMYVLRGELDATSMPPLRAEIRRVFEDGQAHFILFELSAVTFVDSVGLGLFFAAHRMCERTGGATALACPQVPVRDTLAATGLSRTVYTGPTRADAIIYLTRVAHGHGPSVEAADEGVLD